MSAVRPWCCPEWRCNPIHALQGGDKPLTEPEPGESFICFGQARSISFVYDGVEHANDLRTCHYTPLKGLTANQENVEDWEAVASAYNRAGMLLRSQRQDDDQ